jgi:5-methylcytosine-specific restriction endonuclease McrA
MSTTYGWTPKEIQEVREKVRIKANYRCYFCNKDIRKSTLSCTTHHIIPKILLKDNFWNEDNLICICRDCHNKLTKMNDKILRFIQKIYFVRNEIEEPKKAEGGQ